MPSLQRPEMAEGTYVFESFPTALSEKFQPYRSMRKTNKEYRPNFFRCPNTEYLKPLHKIPRAKAFKGGYLASDIPPVAGRLHVDVQTDLYLEELVERIEMIDKCTQTDDFLNRPLTPYFIPQKTGYDVSTQINEADLFDFDLEVQPVLEVLITKTMEQALLEVMEEEELANIRCEINRQGELRAAYLTEIMRREEQNKRYREEYQRRLKEAKERLRNKLLTSEKILTNHFVKMYLDPLMKTVFDNLFDVGYFKDNTAADIKEHFINDLLVQTLNKLNPHYRAHLTMDGMIREATDQLLNEQSSR